MPGEVARSLKVAQSCSRLERSESSEGYITIALPLDPKFRNNTLSIPLY